MDIFDSNLHDKKHFDPNMSDFSMEYLSGGCKCCSSNYVSNCLVSDQFQEPSGINNLAWSSSLDCNHHHLYDQVTATSANGLALSAPSEHVINVHDLYSNRPDQADYSCPIPNYRISEPFYQNPNGDAYYCSNFTTQPSDNWSENELYPEWSNEMSPHFQYHHYPSNVPVVMSLSAHQNRFEAPFNCDPVSYSDTMPNIAKRDYDRCAIYNTPGQNISHQGTNMFVNCLPCNEYKNCSHSSIHSSMSVNLEMNMTVPHTSNKNSMSNIQMRTQTAKYKVMTQLGEHITIKEHNITDVYRIKRNSHKRCKAKTLYSQMKHVNINRVNERDPSIGLKGACNADKEPSDKIINKINLCIICGKTYARPSTLKTHLRTHSGEKPYRCHICDKAFSQAANLTAHIRTHSGEKPFPCPVCHRRFSQSSSVTTHLRTHSGERPYCCSFCRKAFSDSSTLTKHLRIHSGEKPYQCRMCFLRFSQSGNLNRHMRVHMQIIKLNHN